MRGDGNKARSIWNALDFSATAPAGCHVRSHTSGTSSHEEKHVRSLSPSPPRKRNAETPRKRGARTGGGGMPGVEKTRGFIGPRTDGETHREKEKERERDTYAPILRERNPPTPAGLKRTRNRRTSHIYRVRTKHAAYTTCARGG